jgi:hypothetical protein
MSLPLVRLKEKGAKKSDGAPKNLLLAVVLPNWFFWNRFSRTLFRMRSSAKRINNGMLLTKLASSFSV